MPSWFVEESDYQQTSGIEFDYMRSGYLNIQPTDANAGDAVSMPFLWWWPQYTYFSYNSYFWWWDGNQLATGGNAAEEELNDLRFVKFELDEDPDEFYYLVIPELKKNPFTDLNGIDLELDGYDPTYEDGLFEEILNGSYEFLGVEDAELGIADLLNWVELDNQQEITAAIERLAPQPLDNERETAAMERFVPSPDKTESVPEPSAVSGVLVVGVVLLAAIAKRSFSNFRQRLDR